MPELVESLQELNASVHPLLEPGGVPSGVPNSMAMVQQPIQSPRFQLSEGLTQQIGRARGNIAEIPKLLRPFIEARIVGPAFERLNTDWQEFTVPVVSEAAQVIAGKLKEGEQSSPPC